LNKKNLLHHMYTWRILSN